MSRADQGTGGAASDQGIRHLHRDRDRMRPACGIVLWVGGQDPNERGGSESAPDCDGHARQWGWSRA